MPHYKIELCKNPTTKILVRYYCDATEGIAIITLTKKIKRNIKLSWELCHVAGGIIDGLSAILLLQYSDRSIIVIDPVTDLSSIIDDEQFMDEFYLARKEYWYVNKMPRRNRKKEVPTETIYIELRSQGFLLQIHSYVRTIQITNSIFTAYIPYSEIGI